jgi:integrative and conjugative element protein (TIGR02256 family)
MVLPPALHAAFEQGGVLADLAPGRWLGGIRRPRGSWRTWRLLVTVLVVVAFAVSLIIVVPSLIIVVPSVVVVAITGASHDRRVIVSFSFGSKVHHPVHAFSLPLGSRDCQVREMRRTAWKPRGEEFRVAWVSDGALRAMRQEAERHRPLETGGVLVGYRVKQAVVITDAAGAGAHAKHGQLTYSPDDVHDAAIIRQFYERSGRVLTYLGDWHTHPGGSIELSALDVQALGRIASHAEARASRALMAVLAGGTPWRLAVWTTSGDAAQVPRRFFPLRTKRFRAF